MFSKICTKGWVKQVELSKQRVRLRIMKIEDAEDLYNIVKQNPDIWTYMPVKMDSLLDMKNIIDECLQKKKTGEIVPFIVEDIWNNKIVGSTRLYDISLSSKTLEMGYTFFSSDAQRTSINTESKFLLLQYAFETLGVKRVQIKTDLRNNTAQKAIERLGAVKEGILRNERLLYNGLVRDAVVYSILDREWNVVKEKLESYITYSLAQS